MNRTPKFSPAVTYYVLMFASFYAGAVITAQALKIKFRLLEHHKENKLVKPLSDEEVKALNAFTASKLWASKKAILDLSLWLFIVKLQMLMLKLLPMK